MRARRLTESRLGELFAPWAISALIGYGLMQTAWVTPWLLVFNQASFQLPIFATYALLAGIFLASALFVRLADGLAWPENRIRIGLLSLLVGSMWLSTMVATNNQANTGVEGMSNQVVRNLSDVLEIIPVNYIIWLAVVVLWGLGLRIGRELIGPRSFIGAYQAGLTGFGALGVSVLIFNLAGLLEPIFFLAVFFFTGQLGMAAARIASLSRLRGGGRLPFNRSWVSFLSLTVISVTGLVFLIAGIFTGQATHIINLLSSIAFVIGLVAALPAILVIGLLSSSGSTGIDPAMIPTATPAGLAPEYDGLGQNPPGMLLIDPGQVASPEIIQLLSLLGLVLLIGLIVIWMRWSVRPIPAGDGAEIERIDAGEDLLALLRGGMRNLFPTDDSEPQRKLSSQEQVRAAQRIRQIYRAFEVWGRESGHPRASEATPADYANELSDLKPEASASIHVITRAYQTIRYGEVPETPADVHAVERAWEQVRQGEVERNAQISQ